MSKFGVQVNLGTWVVASCVPALATILSLPWILHRLYPPGVTKAAGARAARRVPRRGGADGRAGRLMSFALLFASSYFSTITPQGGSQNVIFVGGNYLTQGELYRLGIMTTTLCLFPPNLSP